jgi:aspartate 1-decarboxylase
MRRTMLKSKIHRATVTATELDYEGSLTIDTDLLAAADILPNEQIHVWDVTNGTRLVTYALPGPAGSGVVQVNGAGAHIVKPADVVIIATFTTLRGRAARKHVPAVVFVGEGNRVRGTTEGEVPPPVTAPPAVTNGAPPAKPKKRAKA